MSESQRWTNPFGARGAARNAARALEERRRSERRVDDLAVRLGGHDGHEVDHTSSDAA